MKKSKIKFYRKVNRCQFFSEFIYYMAPEDEQTLLVFERKILRSIFVGVRVEDNCELYNEFIN